MKINNFQLKPILLSFILVIIMTGLACAQNIRLNAYSAYVFDDRVDSYYDPTNYYDGKIKGGFQWGIGLEYMLYETKGIELRYFRQDTKAPMNYYLDGIQYTEFDLGLNYILLGGSNYFKLTNEMVEPYLGAGIGMAIFSIKNPESGRSSSAEKFAWNIKAGTNIWVTDRVGIKLHAEVISAVQAAGGGFYFGTGGSGAGISTYSSMYQWSLGGGLTFKLGN
jgi:opacity protein-like surface antigen